MEIWLLSGIVILIASLLQTSTGFGFSVIATPFLLLIYNVHDAIQINLILSITISIYMMSRIKNEIDNLLLIGLIKGSILGVPFGIVTYLFADVRILKITVSIIILFFTALLLLRFKIVQTEKRDMVAGGFSGLFTSSIGMPGPPLLIYFAGIGTEKTTVRSTLLAYYCFIYSISLVLQILFGGTNQTIWLSSLASIPIVALGIILGQLFFKWMTQKTFLVIVYILIFFAGFYLLITSF